MTRITTQGASCVLGPSLTADAIRLGSLRADTPQALERLMAELPDPPWDAEVAADDDLAQYLRVQNEARPQRWVELDGVVSGLFRDEDVDLRVPGAEPGEPGQQPLGRHGGQCADAQAAAAARYDREDFSRRIRRVRSPRHQF